MDQHVVSNPFQQTGDYTKIVAITGKRGHGKTTAAMALESQGYRHINFADCLKEVVEMVYGVPMAVLQDPVLKEQVLVDWPYRSPRELLQIVGTDMFRKTKFPDGEAIDDTWIRNFQRRAVAYSHVVCSDLRFPNEAETVLSLGGLIIKVVDPRKVTGDAASQHASETAIDLITPHVTIFNDGTIADLQEKIRKACL